MPEISISLQNAIDLCKNVQEKNRRKWWSYYRWWCWGCNKFSKTPEFRCFRTDDGRNTGCPQINRILQSPNT